MENNINDILNSVEKVKISIVMQVTLEDYPGSRADSINKFRRAIKSFQNQIYKNCELIIVADGCIKTQEVYTREFKNDLSIKFIFVDKNGANTMYEKTENGIYYRGFPRRVGVGAATGSLITYMDSDDYLLPEFTMTLMLMYNTAPDKSWWINASWYDSDVCTWPEDNAMFETDHSLSTKIQGLDGKWTPTSLKPGKIVLAPWLFMHKSDCTTKWRDTIGTSEDVDFNKRLRSEYPEGYSFARPIYARCHYAGKWDV